MGEGGGNEKKGREGTGRGEPCDDDSFNATSRRGRSVHTLKE